MKRAIALFLSAIDTKVACGDSAKRVKTVGTSMSTLRRSARLNDDTTPCAPTRSFASVNEIKIKAIPVNPVPVKLLDRPYFAKIVKTFERKYKTMPKPTTMTLLPGTQVSMKIKKTGRFYVLRYLDVSEAEDFTANDFMWVHMVEICENDPVNEPITLEMYGSTKDETLYYSLADGDFSGWF